MTFFTGDRQPGFYWVRYLAGGSAWFVAQWNGLRWLSPGVEDPTVLPLEIWPDRLIPPDIDFPRKVKQRG